MSGLIRNNGFTLIELMVVIALLAIAVSVAVPSFQTMILNNRLTTSTNALLSGLQLARSEAVTTRTTITICGANAAQDDCIDSTNWSNGTLIRQGTTLIRIIPPVAGVTVTSSDEELAYVNNGTAKEAATVTLTDARGVGFARTINVNVIGPSCTASACP